MPAHPAAGWARLLDQPAGGPVPVGPPRPTPPVGVRPRRLRLTEVETWLRDPYSIYARHVLRLSPLDALEPDVEAADYGTIVHRAMAAFLDALPLVFPADAAARLTAAMDQALDQAALRPALTAWWRPRLHRIAAWAARQEGLRRDAAQPLRVVPEVDGTWQVPAPGKPFFLRGRADRIDILPEGRLAILDYKTGTLPTKGDVAAGLAPQLPLEAAMALAGGFLPQVSGVASEMTYWQLSGGQEPGKVFTIHTDPADAAAAAQEAQANLARLIAAYDDPARAYLSQPHPGAAPRFPEYAQLARVAEWAAAEDLAGDVT